MTKNLLLLLLLWSFTLSAQQEIGLHFNRDLWQSNRTNPAFTTNQQLTVTLPSLYFNTETENFAFSDLLSENESGETILNINQIIGQLADRNELSENLQIQTLGIAYQLGKLTLSVDHSIRQNATFDYPKTLPQLIWQGNAQFIGETVDLTHQLNLTAYHEFALGGAFQVTEQLSVGARAKLLSGIGNISTERGDLTLTTSDDVYQLTLAGDYLINSAGYFDFGGFSDFNLDFDLSGLGSGEFLSSNTGLAFDFGAELQLEKLTIAVSIVDLGSINWSDNVNNYGFNQTVEYTGLDVAQAYVEGDISLTSALDTLDQIFNPTETQVTYSTTLPSRFYLSGTYEINEKLTAGALFNGLMYNEQLTPTVAASLRYRLNDNLSVGGTYAVIDETYANVGLNVNAQLGFVQFYALTDNVVGLLNSDYNNANARIGLNLQFGN
ncbi:MAG: DUF5723 family protein [Saprospiraceae bacterium]